MINLKSVATAAMVTFGLLFLGGCQTTGQSGSSTYAGKEIGKTVKNTKHKRLSHKKKSKKVVLKARSGSKGRKARKGYKGRVGKGSHAYDHIIRRHAKANGVPYALARAVVQVESGFRPKARGSVGEVGLMQLRKNTARGVGYRGSTRALYVPETNIKYGMRYLGKAYRLGGRSTCGAILKYNAGHGAKRMNPVSRRYCNKVQRIMRRWG